MKVASEWCHIVQWILRHDNENVTKTITGLFAKMAALKSKAVIGARLTHVGSMIQCVIVIFNSGVFAH